MRNTNIFTKDDYEKMGSPSRLEVPYGYTKIDGWAFNGSHIQSCSLPYSIEEIGDFAFNECMQLTSCNIPSSVLIIGVHAFGRCYNLSTITIPSSVAEIRMGAFCDSGIYSINIPDSVEIIGGYLFRHCINLKQIDVERKYIYDRANARKKINQPPFPS